MAGTGFQRPLEQMPYIPSSQHALQYHPAMLQPPPSAIKPIPLRLQPATLTRAASEPPTSAQTDPTTSTTAAAVADPSFSCAMHADAGPQHDAQACTEPPEDQPWTIPTAGRPSGPPGKPPSRPTAGAVPPPVSPWPWPMAKQPYMLSSLPHVMHQLLHEVNTDFLQPWRPPADPAAAAAGPTDPAPIADLHTASSVREEDGNAPSYLSTACHVASICQLFREFFSHMCSLQTGISADSSCKCHMSHLLLLIQAWGCMLATCWLNSMLSCVWSTSYVRPHPGCPAHTASC